MKANKITSKAERTRQLIIEKTAPIFNKKGYAGTSLSDITEATGLTKGSIYGNFADKDEVAMAAFDYNVARMREVTKEELTKHSTARAQLLAYVDVYQNYMKYSSQVGGCPIMNTTVDADDTHPVLKGKVCQVMIAWKDRVAGLIEKGIANKEFKKDTDPEQAALTLFAMIEGAILINQATGRADYRKKVMQSIEKMIKEL